MNYFKNILGAAVFCIAALVNHSVVAQTELEPIPRGIISHSGNRQPIPQAIIENPNVVGFLVIDRWSQIEPVEGEFDWSHIDSEIARAEEEGIVVRLALHLGGDDTPDWVMENYPEIKQIYNYDKRSGEKIWFPAYWDRNFLKVKGRLYKAIGERYRKSPAVFALPASMCDPNTGDWAFIIKDEEQYQTVIDAGFTEARFISAHKQVINMAMRHYGDKYVVTAVGGLPSFLKRNGDIEEDSGALNAVLEYAFNRYSTRLIIAKGALHAKTPHPIETDNLKGWQTIYDYRPQAAAQFVWSFDNDREYKMNGKTPYTADEIPRLFDEIMERVWAYELNWIEPWKADLLNPDFDDIFTAINAEFNP